jgi:hypothetical protein
MPCDVPCDQCPHIDKCGGEPEEEGNQTRQCSDSCGHYDSLNRCCWQATEKGLCFHVSEGDYCQLGYKENDFR